MSSDEEKAQELLVKVEEAFAGWERKYHADGLRPIRWAPSQREGCWACGKMEEEGLWRINAMTSTVRERGEALLFIAVLCRACQGNEDRRDQAIKNVVSDYLKAHESKHR